MKVNFNETIKDIFSKKPIINTDKITQENKEDLDSVDRLTAKYVVAKALLSPYEGEDADAAEKTRRFVLAERIADAGDDETEITTEEATLIKNLTSKLFGPLVVGQITRLIEG